MGVRLRITLLFASIVLVILFLVCGSVYFFSYKNRIANITTRLTNRAITTARLLSHSETFDRILVQKIDSATTIALNRKTIEAFDSKNNAIYAYTDLPGDRLTIDNEVLDRARIKKNLYFTVGDKDVVACHVIINDLRVVMVIGAVDIDGKEKLRQIRLIIFFSFLGGLLIAIAGGYIFSAGLIRPIRKIADEVNEISANNLSRRIQQNNVRDEWDYLSTTLNRLLNRLQDSFEIQQRFIANASHELFTPLTSISSQLEVTLLKERNTDDYRRVMESVYHDVKQLNQLTQTLLEFASASGNPTGVVIDLIRIDEILLRLPAAMLKVNPSYSTVLDFKDLPPNESLLLVWANEHLLFSALCNIVSNACKYSSDHKALVHLIIRDESICITISDRGPGITEIEQQNIFQPFYRIKTDASVKGFGLGLPLANRIIKLHRGFISVQSTPGAGSDFIIQLPVANKYLQQTSLEMTA